MTQGNNAILKFEVEIDGVIVNGVDMISWNQDNRLVDFKVMLRPLKAINLIHQRMAFVLRRFPGREQGW